MAYQEGATLSLVGLRMAPVEGAPLGLFVVVSPQGPLNLFVRALLIAVDRLGVEAEQDGDAVASPSRNFRRRCAGLKPERDARARQAYFGSSSISMASAPSASFSAG